MNMLIHVCVNLQCGLHRTENADGYHCAPDDHTIQNSQDTDGGLRVMII